MSARLPLGMNALLRGLALRLRALLRSFKSGSAVPPAIEAEYLRQIYRNLAAGSPISLAMVVYLAAQAEPDTASLVRIWAALYSIYICLRWAASLLYPRQREPEPQELRRWSILAVIIQGTSGFLVAILALFVLPTLDLYAQIVACMVVLILVGATAFSLSGRWVDTLVFAPPIYLSFAWHIFGQDHPYAHGVSALPLALFVLHLVYASNHRKSILKGFEVARRSADLARELQFKNIEYQELASARSRLLATVSHDLRQPAHAIGLLSERALADNSFASVKATLRDLNELSQSLSASLITLMDLTRLDAGLVKPRMAAVSLAQVLLRLDAEFGASARAKGLVLEVERSQAWVQSDPVLLQGILSNLISNAIKYTRQGRVDVRVIDKGAQLQIEVIDTGQGISVDKLELIFKEFVRLDASDSGTEGLGLGLSIVRRYASLMSHALHVQSVPGQGSSFTVTLARAHTPERVVESLASAPTELADDHGLAGLHVLVIDNVELLLVSMSKTLSGWGCQVRSARNMTEALQCASQQWPDLVVSDHHLGDREPNGLELIKGLREQGAREGRKRLPALLMTGDVSPQLEAQAREAGVRILHKPVRPKVLRASLAELMRRSAQAGAVPVPRAHG